MEPSHSSGMPMMDDPNHRFDRLNRLVGPGSMKTLAASHVMVVGAGGVGSWAAEAVMRSAIGRLTVVDFDAVCIRNFNRQLQALEGTIGQPKAELLVERLRQINPAARVEAVSTFFSQDTAEKILHDRPNFVIDAIDHVTSKCFLIDYCKRLNIPLVVSTGSGGRVDPTQIRVMDLARTEQDPLARAIRRILREKYAFPARALFGIPAVVSLEPASDPLEGSEMTACSAGCRCPQGENDFQSCTRKSVVMGTASFVTGAFGLACASVAIRSLLAEDRTGVSDGR